MRSGGDVEQARIVVRDDRLRILGFLVLALAMATASVIFAPEASTRSARTGMLIGVAVAIPAMGTGWAMSSGRGRVALVAVLGALGLVVGFGGVRAVMLLGALLFGVGSLTFARLLVHHLPTLVADDTGVIVREGFRRRPRAIPWSAVDRFALLDGGSKTPQIYVFGRRPPGHMPYGSLVREDVVAVASPMLSLADTEPLVAGLEVLRVRMTGYGRR